MKMQNFLLLVGYFSVLVIGKTYFKETFDNGSWEDIWVHSEWKENVGKFVLSSGSTWKVDENIEQGIQTPTDAKFYSISAPIPQSFSNEGEDLVVQFSVKNEGKESSFCGGGYIKLLPAQTDLKSFGGDSEYYIMFGPDMCGYDISRIHLIFNDEGNNLLKNNEIKLEYADKDDKTHLYTLIIKPDNSYEVLFDQKLKSGGFLHDEWDFPKKWLPDATDVKPADWEDEEMIPDTEDIKPEGWDDVKEYIPDSNAAKPDDWDEEEDGAWEAPKIKNSMYKGAWKPRMISNPNYKGPWVQKQIENPDYKEDVYFYREIGAVGFELWIVNKGSIFDNIYVGNSLEEANELADQTWKKIQPFEDDAKAEWDKLHQKSSDSDDDDSIPEDLDDLPTKEDL